METIKVENPKSLIFRVFLRFLRTFVSAGIAQIAIIIVANPLVNLDLTNIKTWLAILITAFVTGGILGVDKARRG